MKQVSEERPEMLRGRLRRSVVLWTAVALAGLCVVGCSGAGATGTGDPADEEGAPVSSVSASAS